MQDIATIYETHFDAILNFVVKRVRNLALAEDITAGVFMKVVEKLHTYNPEKACMQTWLFSIASHELVNYYRKKKPESSLEDYEYLLKTQDVLDEIHEKQQEIDQDTAINDMLAKLDTAVSSEEKHLLMLFYFEEKSYADIAYITGIKEVTLRSKIHRAIKKLKECYPMEEAYEKL